MFIPCGVWIVLLSFLIIGVSIFFLVTFQQIGYRYFPDLSLGLKCMNRKGSFWNYNFLFIVSSKWLFVWFISFKICWHWFCEYVWCSIFYFVLKVFFHFFPLLCGLWYNLPSHYWLFCSHNVVADRSGVFFMSMKDAHSLLK